MENREWIEGKLLDIANIKMGQSPKGETCNNSNGLPLLNGPTEFGLKHPKEMQYTTDSRKECVPLDILFCVRGSTTGRMNWADKVYSIGRGLAAINHKSGADYNYFIKGLLDYNLDLLLASATGSTFPNISRSQLENLEIQLPPLPEQKAIASVLSSLDDKIDLLHQQNQTLEALAETLFRQWFIEEAKEDWEDCTIEDLCIKINSGGTPSTKIDSYYNGNINWYSTKELNDNFLFSSNSKITQEGLDNSSAKIFPAGTVVIAIYAAPTVGRLGILTEDSAFNQAACGLVANDKICSKEFLYLYLKNQRVELNLMASGSAQQNLNVGKIKSYPCFIPDSITMEKFKFQVIPLFSKVLDNSKQIQTLTQLRDTLLPKLMSGEVRVKV